MMFPLKYHIKELAQKYWSKWLNIWLESKSDCSQVEFHSEEEMGGKKEDKIEIENAWITAI